MPALHKRGAVMDLNDKYLIGVGELLKAIEPTDADYLEVLGFQGRLAQVISETRQYGPTDNTRAEMARVTKELDRLCPVHLGKSFQSLCGIDESRELASPSAGDGNVIDVEDKGKIETEHLLQESQR